MSHWLKVDLTLKHKTTLSTTTISLTNRVEIDDTSNEHWPLLEEITDIGSSFDNVSVLPNTGSIFILDELGSFGVERKFSDLLERYSIINQDIEIFYDSTAVSSENPSSYSTIFKGKVFDWTILSDRVSPRIQLSFDSKLLNKRFITKKVTSDDFPDAPNQSLFKTLPIVFGNNVQVRPLLIDAEGDTDPKFAYATTLGTEFPNDGISNYYILDRDNRYRRIATASVVSTPVIQYGNFVNNIGDYGGTALGGGEQAWRLDTYNNSAVIDLSTDNYGITHVDVFFSGVNDGAAAVSGQVFVKIYDHDPVADWPGQVLATGVRDKTDFTSSIRGSTDFTVVFTLDKVVPLTNRSDYYYLSVGQTNTSGDTGTMQIGIPNTGGVMPSTVSNPQFDKAGYVTSTFGEWRKLGDITQHMQYAIYGIKMTDTATPISDNVNNIGLGHSYFQVTQLTAPTSQPNPTLTDLNFIVAVDGLKDDGSGTITGSAGSQILNAHHAVKLLSREWSGTAWDASTSWDFTAYSTTHDSSRTISGTTTGNVTYEEWLRDICKNSASKVALRKNGKLGFYTWGSEQASAATFDQENSKVISCLKLDASYVLNKMTIAYARQLISFNALNIPIENVSSDYTAVLRRDADTNTEMKLLIGNSEALYGAREFVDILFDWIDSLEVAKVLNQFYLTNYNEPPVYVELEVPFSYFAILEPLSVVKIKHPALPTYFGSSPKTGLPHYSGVTIEPSGGYVLTRAKTYHGQTEGMEISFSGDAVPSLKLTCRLLLNPNDPTYITN